MSGHRRPGIDSTAFDSLLTMSNSTIKLVLIFKKFNILESRKFNTNVVQEVFSGAPTNQSLGCAIVAETGCRAGKFTSRTLMQITISRGFPLPFNVEHCKLSGHFSRFRIIIGNFCIVKQKYYVFNEFNNLNKNSHGYKKWRPANHTKRLVG
jgi:hypothetical protein